ncbi:hypothetical protein CDD81_1976 [Ophiocordyceps australis]|uniref:Uncharacterized protein n=1 Tax=Ophiocordyceps australis TaxID=1399860 RepID=A0A2C5XXP4_9HYPO|nr:hypothetical protein CDD81_1976 [Ophiocordyceps australis]
MSFLDAPKCTDAPDATPSDAGVAGTGILLSFIATAFIAIALSASVIFAEFRGNTSRIRRKLLNGYSDSQILQGIGIQSVGLAKMNTLVPYHFFLIWMLSLLSMSTHNATLLALVQDYRRDWVIRWLKQFLMFVNLALSCLSGVFVLQAVSKGLENGTLPIGCVWHVGGNGAPANVGLSYVGTIFVIAGNCIVFALATWYLHRRGQRFFKLLQSLGLLLMTAIAVGAAVRIGLLSQAFGHPPVKLSDQGEKVWSFGQLLSMLLLVMPLVSVVEIYRGELQMAAAMDESKQRLYDGELQSKSHLDNYFQPAPLANLQTKPFARTDHELPGATKS